MDDSQPVTREDLTFALRIQARISRSERFQLGRVLLRIISKLPAEKQGNLSHVVDDFVHSRELRGGE